MKTLLILCVAAAINVGAMPLELQDEENPCDLKKIEKAFYCSFCETIDPKVDEKGLCPCDAFSEKPQKVDVCLKEVFECSECGGTQAKDELCCDEAKNKKVTVKALVVFRCEECWTDGESEGDCMEDTCQEAGNKIRKTCKESGSWPHGGSDK